jgi:predicted nucleic acid-binding protein
MVAPDGINPEILSTLRRLERIGELRADRASLAVDHLLGAPVRRFPTLPLLPAAWKLRATSPPTTPATSPWPVTLAAR